MPNPIGTDYRYIRQSTLTGPQDSSHGNAAWNFFRRGLGLAREALLPGSGAIGGRLSDLSGGLDSAKGDFADLFAAQLEIQRFSQESNMLTNAAKTVHDARMAAIRNVRS